MWACQLSHSSHCSRFYIRLGSVHISTYFTRSIYFIQKRKVKRDQRRIKFSAPQHKKLSQSSTRALKFGPIERSTHSVAIEMPQQDRKFEGWLGHDKDSAKGKLVWGEFEPKPWEETDVEIEVSHCGICATDLHTLRSGHGPVRLTICSRITNDKS
jgi:hypothetical protein